MSTAAFCLKATVDLVSAHASRSELTSDEFLGEIGRVFQVLSGLAGSREKVTIGITRVCEAPDSEVGGFLGNLGRMVELGLMKKMVHEAMEAARVQAEEGVVLDKTPADPGPVNPVDESQAAVAPPETQGAEAAPSESLEAKAPPEPKVPIENSVQGDRIFCLQCGAGMRTLKAHLRVAHGLTPETYRERFGLDKDYPLVCLDYSASRSAMAKDMGLGQKARPATPEAE